MAPTRAAALAVCLLALAVGASAQCASVGYFKLDLVSAASTSAPFARCLTSFKINVVDTTTCGVSIEPVNSAGNYVTGLWSSNSATTYNSYIECPTVTGGVVRSGATPTDVKADIATALSGFIYGYSALPAGTAKYATTATVAYTATGKITITVGGNAFVYAVTKVTGTSADIDANMAVAADCTSFVDGDASTDAGECINQADAQGLATRCGTATSGRYGIAVDSNLIKFCGVCPAGSIGDGYTCTPCAGGKNSASVGSSTCATCSTAGTYSPAGSSTCLPCPAGTFNDVTTGVETCTECPDDTYSYIPGASQCLRCVQGVPQYCDATGCTAKGGAQTVYASLAASSPGGSIVGLTGANTACTTPLTGSYAVPAYDNCDSWGAAATAGQMRLAFEVAGDCSIDIKPITERKATCTDPANAAFGNNIMRVYYHWDGTQFQMRSLLSGTSTDAYMVGVVVAGAYTNAAAVGTLTLWQASNNPATAATVSASTDKCTNALTVTGGSLSGSTPITTCPVGSYQVFDTGVTTGTTNYCYACPPGTTCQTTGLNTPTNCAQDYYNQFLGRDTACDTCDAAAVPRYTAYEGAASCTVPYVDMQCDSATYTAPTAARYYDPATQTCELCPAGTYRDDASQTCMDCPIGTYSKAGGAVTAAGCTNCPVGQYNPSTGLGSQETGGNGLHCLLCPEGSLPLSGAQAAAFGPSPTLAVAATFCDPCPAGSIQDGASAIGADWACTICGVRTYRSGQASPENNVCENVPAGYKITNPAARDGITLCPAGSVSYWTGATRTPAAEDECIACGNIDDTVWGHTYAPRAGMTQCIPCPAGRYPITTGTTATDTTVQCDACADGYYRSVSMTGSNGVTCTSCPAGKEVGPSGKASCTLCRPGFYKPTSGAADGSNVCSKCQQHKYRPTPGGVSCTNCPKGTETQDTGNTECTPCQTGYYNGITGAACQPTVAGTFTNVTGAWFPTPCPKGTWNNEVALDTCNACPAGQYASTLGSKSCKTCPAGTFSNTRAAQCTDCRAGYFAPLGSSSCQACKPGTYSPSTKSPFCLPCLKGYQCPTTAMSATAYCPAGTYSNKEGNKMCTPCPVNTYSAVNNAAVTTCTKCGTGTGTRGLVGQSACQTLRPQVRRLRSLLNI